jgi:hypothetical protein
MVDATQSNAIVYDQASAGLIWERSQEQGVRAYRERNTAAAISCWNRALAIAERHFERGDPRIAASLTNVGFALQRQEQLHNANQHFGRAISAWQDCWRWVPLMTPPPQPNATEPGSYNDDARRTFYDMAKNGRQITEAMLIERRMPIGGLEQWQEVKPHIMTDLRKLMASIFLIVSKEG